MRRLLPTARSFLIHSGQLAGLAVVATLAMAAAPQAMHVAVEAPPAEDAVPTAPAIVAAVEPPPPTFKILAFGKPVAGFSINSNYGTRHLAGEAKPRQHAGVDIAAPTGTPVLSSAEGVVTSTGYDAGGYGNFVEVRHPNGVRSFYAHLSRIEVRSGARVDGGQRIGRVGSTGYSTGPHLHFEIRRAGGAKVNPTRYIDREFKIALA